MDSSVAPRCRLRSIVRECRESAVPGNLDGELAVGGTARNEYVQAQQRINEHIQILPCRRREVPALSVQEPLVIRQVIEGVNDVSGIGHVGVANALVQAVNETSRGMREVVLTFLQYMPLLQATWWA